MKMMKKLLVVLLVAVMPALTYAQPNNRLLRQRLEIVELDNEDAVGWHDTSVEVFSIAGEEGYWLSLGHPGIGTDIVQLDFDPVYELFIPLGNTLVEAQEKMQEIKAFFKSARKSSMQIEGCLSAILPNPEQLEPVTVTVRRYLTSRLLEFSVPRGGLVRASYISKNEFGSLLVGVKIHRKLHPKQQ